MLAISWNIRGLNSKIKRSSLRKKIQTHNPAFVFIQETKSENFTEKSIISIWNEPGIQHIFSPSIGNSGGLLSLWNENFFQIESQQISRHWIAICGTITLSNFRCCLINVYNPCSHELRNETWLELIDFRSLVQLPCLLMGDFNEIREISERGSQIASQRSIDDFNNFINESHLTEIQASNGIFTWFHGHSKSKLDRVLLNTEWMLQFPSLNLTLMKRGLSDHCPLLLNSKDSESGPKPFRFQNVWLTHPDCLKLIRNTWVAASDLGIADKLRAVKKELKNWNTSVFGHIDLTIAALEEKIHSLDLMANSRDLEDTEIDERKRAQQDLWLWLKRRETHWAQNSRAKWIKEGDRNTKYFHTMATMRKRKNNITFLRNNETNHVDCACLKKEAIAYFKSIFNEDDNSRPFFTDLNFRKLSNQQADMLTAPVTQAEIDVAVDSCDPQKAPGPDGFNFRFVKSAWEVIKEDVYRMVEDFWTTSKLPKGTNVALIALIAKIDNPEGFKDFRPISMVGCIYKIIAKVLARRLQSVMDTLIGPFQSSFIKGRQILDGALVAGEIIDSCQRRNIKTTILKLDFHKAFDSISWQFMDWTLSQMGFPTQWRKWIGACVMSASASILINGSPTTPFKLHRGLRQGDPLSPFLFDLAVETLSLIIQKASNLKLWEGIEVCKGGMKVTHLQYADDTILFCPPRLEYLLNIKMVLILFQMASGLQVNFHKSSLLGVHTDEIWLQNTADALLCKKGSLPFTYLGLPIGGNVSVKKT